MHTQLTFDFHTFFLSKGTRACSVYQVAYATSRNVFLVDTPGFDDSDKSDAEILSMLANWLAVTYSNRTKLHGILYLHRIIDVRMQGSARRNLKVFKDLCGPDALEKVVLVTTMWEKLASRDEVEARELQLKTANDYWGYMVKKGSKIMRHTNDMQSAKKLVDMFLPPDDNLIPQVAGLAIQEEMTVQNKSVAETTAGESIRDKIAREEIRFATAVEEYRQEVQEALRERDDQRRSEFQELVTEMESDMERLRRREEVLRRDMEQMVKESYDQVAVKNQEDTMRRLSEQYKIRSVSSLEARSVRSAASSRSNSTLSSWLSGPPTQPLARPLFRFNHPLSLSLRGRHCSFIGPLYTKS